MYNILKKDEKFRNLMKERNPKVYAEILAEEELERGGEKQSKPTEMTLNEYINSLRDYNVENLFPQEIHSLKTTYDFKNLSEETCAILTKQISCFALTMYFTKLILHSRLDGMATVFDLFDTLSETNGYQKIYLFIASYIRGEIVSAEERVGTLGIDHDEIMRASETVTGRVVKFSELDKEKEIEDLLKKKKNNTVQTNDSEDDEISGIDFFETPLKLIDSLLKFNIEEKNKAHIQKIYTNILKNNYHPDAEMYNKLLQVIFPIVNIAIQSPDKRSDLCQQLITHILDEGIIDDDDAERSIRDIEEYTNLFIGEKINNTVYNTHLINCTLFGIRSFNIPELTLALEKFNMC